MATGDVDPPGGHHGLPVRGPPPGLNGVQAPARTEREGPEALLRWGAASIWLLTGLLVLHPSYRVVGLAWLDRFALPGWLMWAACAGEVALGVTLVVASPRSRPLLWAQLLPMAFFTTLLAWKEPLLLAHPFGILSKNLPLAALALARWRAASEGWTPRALWTLRAGMAVVWLTEGLFPKILFQQPMELAVVQRSGLVPFDASHFLVLLGLAQLLSGIAALALKPTHPSQQRWLSWLLLAQAAALVVLPVLVSLDALELWVHPFGPLTKNVPLLLGTLAVRRLVAGSPSLSGS